MSAAPIKVLIASCNTRLVSPLIDAFEAIAPGVPLVVVSEFQPPGVEWIPFHIRRNLRENVDLCRARLAGRRIDTVAIVLEPKRPYRALRLLGVALRPPRLILLDERFTAFQFWPPSPSILRFIARRARTFARHQVRTDSFLHRWFWRFTHPEALRRPVYYRAALAAGWLATQLKQRGTPTRGLSNGSPTSDGISVVIPSRNGADLLAQCLPPLIQQLTASAEIIIVDNGFIEIDRFDTHASVIVERSAGPLSFAQAVNRGIARARFSHVCLLNNDMVVEPGFLAALRRAFDLVPGLFCATAQIFMPEGQRREETGKAVMPAQRPRDLFPLTCVDPIEGEEHTYVLYGSGGASMYDTEKLRALGGFAEVYDPAYVEDLDVGFNGWRQGWPTVFVAGAHVLHRHRSTTSRYFNHEQLRFMLERHYLRFLARSITDATLFAALWDEAITRVNIDCLNQPYLRGVLRQAALAPKWIESQPPAVMLDAEVLAIGSGAIAVFPGRARGERPLAMTVSPYVPFPLSHGGAVRIYNLMRRAARDFAQVLVCFVDDLQPVPPELLEICVEVVYVKRYPTHAIPGTERPDVVEEYDSPAFRAALKQTVRKWKPGIAQLEFTQMAQYAADCAPAATVLVEHDVTFDLFAQLLAQRDDWETRRQYDRWIRFEKQAWSNVNLVVTMSEKDRSATGSANAVTLPNGVDLDRFQPSAEQPDAARILFIGSFAHLPNVLAIDFFLRQVWPSLQPLHPKLHVIAGSRPEYFLDLYKQRVRPDLDQPGIELEAFVSDVRPAYRRAAIVIAPLLASAGTNIKIMEAMAMGKAIVSTPAGINGLDDLRAGHDVVVVNTGAEMARAIADLIADPAARTALQLQARRTVTERYDWDEIAKRQAEMYRSIYR